MHKRVKIMHFFGVFKKNCTFFNKIKIYEKIDFTSQN